MVEVLIAPQEIERRVKELAEEIEEALPSPFVVISLLKGAFIFTADLVRNFRDVELDFMKVESYRGREKGKTKMTLEPKISLEGKRVLIVDDIFDTGESLDFAFRWVKAKGALDVKTCVLLDKEVEKRTSLKPDFVGFRVPDYFVVGYGLDLDEKFRQLPYIGYLKE